MRTIITIVVLWLLIIAGFFVFNHHSTQDHNCWRISETPRAVGMGPARGWSWTIMCEVGERTIYPYVK